MITSDNNNQTELKTKSKTKSQKRKKDTQISFWADDNDVLLLESLAEATGMSKSQIIRHAVKLFDLQYMAELRKKEEVERNNFPSTPSTIPYELSRTFEREIAKV